MCGGDQVFVQLRSKIDFGNFDEIMIVKITDSNYPSCAKSRYLIRR